MNDVEMESQAGDILILRGGGLGDTLLALPAAVAAARHFSSPRFEWVGNPAVLPVMPLGLAELRLRSADGPALALLRREDADPEEIFRAFSRDAPYDLVVAWTPGDEAFEKNLGVLARKVIRADPHPPASSRPVHAVDYLLACLKRLGAPPPLGALPPTGALPPLGGPEAPEIRPTAENLGDARRLLSRLGIGADDPYFVLHPGSGGGWKRWPPSCFVRLAEDLAAVGEVVWLLGPAEEETGKAVRRLTRGASLNILQSPPLPALAGALRRAAGYVGSDSGVTHLAAACGANTVALFGPTPPAVWGPRGEHVVILRRHAGCAACARGGRAGHTCLAEISVEEALEAVLGGGLR